MQDESNGVEGDIPFTPFSLKSGKRFESAVQNKIDKTRTISYNGEQIFVE